MKDYTITLTEAQVRMLAHAIRNNMYDNFMEDHGEAIEDEGSVSWYDDEFTNLANDICTWDEELTDNN